MVAGILIVLLDIPIILLPNDSCENKKGPHRAIGNGAEHKKLIPN